MNKNITYLIIGVVVCIGALYLFSKDRNQKEESQRIQESTKNPLSNNEDSTPEVPEGWKNFQAKNGSYSFNYPDLSNLSYVTAVDWPPQIQILEALPECSEAGELIDRAGKTESKIMEGRDYCVTEKVQGAAGSNYHQYAYLFQEKGKNIALQFTFRFVQCMNYDEPLQSDCQKAQNDFNSDELVSRLAETLVFKS